MLSVVFTFAWGLMMAVRALGGSHPSGGARRSSGYCLEEDSTSPSMLTPDPGLPASRTMINKYLLCISQFICGVCFSSPGGLRHTCELPSLPCCFSVTQLCLTLCDPMDCSTPGSPVLHYLLEFAQIYVH